MHAPAAHPAALAAAALAATTLAALATAPAHLLATLQRGGGGLDRTSGQLNYGLLGGSRYGVHLLFGYGGTKLTSESCLPQKTSTSNFEFHRFSPSPSRMSAPTVSFDSVVGMDLERAKAVIKMKLPYNFLRFVIVETVANKRVAAPKEVSEQDIVLFYDPRTNSVSRTPKFYGRVFNASNGARGYVEDAGQESWSDSEGY